MSTTQKKTTKSTDFEKLHKQCLQNASQYPVIIDTLAKELGVSVGSLLALEVGFFPAKGAFTVPERNSRGAVIGLMLRSTQNNKKWCVGGSKRGLIFPVGGVPYRRIDSRIIEVEGTPYWRLYAGEGVECPICHHDHWCLIEAANKENPSKVICPRTEEGSVRTYRAAGHLHILHGRKPRKDTSRLLPSSDDPVVVCEGFSDTCIALSLGFVVIGKSAASTTPSFLASLLKGRDVIVIGDNDEVGRKGARSTYQILKSKSRTRTVQLVFPPEDRSDLRAWNPTREEFLERVERHEERVEESVPEEFIDYPQWARDFVADNYEIDGRRILHFFLSELDPNDKGEFFRYNGACYDSYNPQRFDKELLEYFRGKTLTKNKKSVEKIVPVPIDSKFLNEIRRMIKAHCEINLPKTQECYDLEQQKVVGRLQKCVAFQNGILDPITGEFAPPSDRIFLSSTLPYNYNPSAKCPEWLAFVNQVFEGDDERIDLLQEWFGYNLVPTDFLESLMIFHGTGRSGKGTTQEVLQAVLGEKRFEAASMKNFTGDFGLSPFIGKYALLISEHRPATRTDASKVLDAWKAITGRDKQSINRKFRSFVTSKLFCKITYSCNDLPRFDDPSMAFDTRLNLLNFDFNFAEAGILDPEMKDRLPKEAQGVAIWALDGLKRLLANKKFTIPKACEDDREEFRRVLNPLRMMEDFCVFEPGAWEPIKTLHNLYIAICKEQNKTAWSTEWLGRKLQKAFPTLKAERRTIGGVQERGYAGIELTKEAGRKYLGRPYEEI